MDNDLKQHLDAMEHRLTALIVDVKESLEREIGKVSERVDRMGTRLDIIAAGSHYVAKLAEWSERQDKYQEDILRRVQALEDQVKKLANGGKP